MIIIGITGTLGAGKGTIVEYLVKKKGFVHFSVRAFLIDEIKKRKLPENRDSMVKIANELRAKHSPSYIIDQLYIKAKSSGNNSIIESIRTPGEIESLKKKGDFYLFAVDAKPQIRFNRILLRNSETDHISYETFLKNEKREMTSDNPNKQNVRRCIELADYVFDNNGKTTELHNKVEKVLREMKT
ncbi:MAG: AAA family ATPase [Bacteroidales bacterium]|nr:AAA family ATPase [Bacteroidales bacterium]